jgi:hypothetical protein
MMDPPSFELEYPRSATFDWAESSHFSEYSCYLFSACTWSSEELFCSRAPHRVEYIRALQRLIT